jgi:hypothetical protein
MKTTAMQELIEELQSINDFKYKGLVIELIKNKLEKEKEQIQKAFSDGQETPLKHPTLPHYSRDEYYNDNYNQNK